MTDPDLTSNDFWLAAHLLEISREIDRAHTLLLTLGTYADTDAKRAVLTNCAQSCARARSDMLRFRGTLLHDALTDAIKEESR